jgi:hypothetical protein
MTVVRVKGFKIFKGRHQNGKYYCYHRKTGERIDLEKYPVGSAGFLAECARINALVEKATPKPGTLGLLIAAYRAHPAFTDLAPRTKSDYQAVFDYLRPIADTPLIKFDKPLVVRIRDKAAQDKGRKFGNDVKARFSGIFGWGSERGYIATNPAAGIKDIRRRKDAPDANRPWADEEREAVLGAVPPHMKPAIALMMFTALGPKDALTLPRSFYKAGEIATRRSKTGEPVFWDCPAPLAAILADAPTHDAVTLCANSDGKPWSVLAPHQAQAGARGQDRTRPDPVRPQAYRRGDLARDRHGRAHDRRRPRTEDDRDGAALREGRRSQAEDARCCPLARGGAGETEIEQKCQTQ